MLMLFSVPIRQKEMIFREVLCVCLDMFRLKITLFLYVNKIFSVLL